MFRVILLLFLALNLHAGEFFKESRYIYAIDKTILFEGEIIFEKNSIKIDYTKPKKEKVVYLVNDENPQKRNYFLILQAIYHDDMNSLKEFFELKQQDFKTLLLPKGMLSEYIKQVEFKKTNKNLDYLKIQMENNDWIKIETLR